MIKTPPSAGRATYDLIPLAWSKDCSKQAFLLELEGRDADAYKNADISQRGLYVYQVKDNIVKMIYPIPNRIFLDTNVKNSNFWSDGDYVFAETTNQNEGTFTDERYIYKGETGQVSLFDHW